MSRMSRYVFGQWLRVFLLTAVGLPVVSILTQLTDNLRKLLDANLAPGTIALSYVYALPQNIAQMMPAACLFAAVFTVGPLARHSELTAAKAGGISFHQIIRPILVVSALAAVVAFLVGEFATHTTSKQLELQGERSRRSLNSRYSFVFRSQSGWVYTVRQLDTRENLMQQVVLERAVRDTAAPLFAITADSARWNPEVREWRFLNGASHLLTRSGETQTMSFAELALPAFRETPEGLLIEPKNHTEMTYGELSGYIASLQSSGNDTKKLEVERAVKLALPAACLIIALFGAPLAVSAPRAGAAVGIAISLGTTIVYLLMINLAQAVGASGLMHPMAAAWSPNLFFLLVGIWLLLKVRT